MLYFLISKIIKLSPFDYLVVSCGRSWINWMFLFWQIQSWFEKWILQTNNRPGKYDTSVWVFFLTRQSLYSLLNDWECLHRYYQLLDKRVGKFSGIIRCVWYMVCYCIVIGILHLVILLWYFPYCHQYRYIYSVYLHVNL